MSGTVETQDLSIAALLRILGATVVAVDVQRGGGTITLDVSRVTKARIKDAADVFVEQLASLPDAPSILQVEDVVSNTLLGPLSRERDVLKNQILKRRTR